MNIKEAALFLTHMLERKDFLNMQAIFRHPPPLAASVAVLHRSILISLFVFARVHICNSAGK